MKNEESKQYSRIRMGTMMTGALQNNVCNSLGSSLVSLYWSSLPQNSSCGMPCPNNAQCCEMWHVADSGELLWKLLSSVTSTSQETYCFEKMDWFPFPFSYIYVDFAQERRGLKRQYWRCDIALLLWMNTFQDMDPVMDLNNWIGFLCKQK